MSRSSNRHSRSKNSLQWTFYTKTGQSFQSSLFQGCTRQTNTLTNFHTVSLFTIKLDAQIRYRFLVFKSLQILLKPFLSFFLFHHRFCQALIQFFYLRSVKPYFRCFSCLLSSLRSRQNQPSTKTRTYHRRETTPYLVFDRVSGRALFDNDHTGPYTLIVGLSGTDESFDT
jgi:hypothetical protein